MPEDMRCDVAIIGAGTAGLSAERAARSQGASTLLIDPTFSGTTCANVGCMPSKLLIAAARAAHTVRHAGVFGLESSLRVDGPAVLRRLRRERDRFAQATRDQIAKLPEGVTVKGSARFADPNTLELDDGRRIAARAIVIAAGARPSVPEEFGAIEDFVLTNETLFELEDLPATLAVVGAGPLGLEIAQAMARLGVAVTLLDEGETMAGLPAGEVAGKVEALLTREMTIYLGVKLQVAARSGRAHLSWSGNATGEASFDKVLVAAGRPPALKELELGSAGLELGEHGTPVFDRETMRCGQSAIFIAGDADASRPVLHEASSEGAIAGVNAATYPEPHKAHRCVPFSIMFTDPPLAVVGKISAETLVIGKSDFGNQGRARVEARADGLAHMLADPGDGRIEGAVLFCPGADHLGHLLAWSMESRATADELLDRPFYHPTFEEGLKPALRAICDQVGIQPPEVSDEGAPAGA